MQSRPTFVKHNLLQLAAAYADYSVLVTTAQLDLPGPQILYANSAFTRMTGYAVSDLLGKTPRILQGEKTDRRILRQIRETLESGHDFVGRAVNYKRDGTPFHLEWVISHLRDSDGNTTHFIAVQRDITGQLRAERELQLYDKELQDASRDLVETAMRLDAAESHLRRKNRFSVLGELTAGVVHDISNALTPVFGLAQLLNGLENLPYEARKYTADLDVSIEHALDVLSNLKTYYIDGNKKPGVELSLQTLLHRLPDITRAKWWSQSREADSPINFALDMQTVGNVEGNEIELLQVFVNVVMNSIDAMSEGGTVTLSLSEEDGMAVVVIEDNGDGMSPELLETCFEPYVSTRSNGTGLGLSVCRRIVEQHKGTIQMSAAEPKGIRCTIRLPLVTPDVAPATPSIARPLKVLHISSDDEERDNVAELLQSLGLKPVCVRSCDEALEHFFADPADVVIAGCSLPIVARYDLTHAIKRKAENVRVLVCQSAETDDHDSWPDLPHPDTFLPAPITEKSLVSVLRELDLL